MKHFNPKTEAIIQTRTILVDFNSSPKEGDMVPHQEKVENVKMYIPQYGSEGYVVSHRQIVLNRDEILDIANQIQEIESKHFNEPYEKTLPF